MEQRPHKLREMAAAQNITIEDVIRKAVKEGGSAVGAARVLGVNRNTVSSWLKRRGMRVVTRTEAVLEKVEAQS